ncbi:50S ribosomal protein L6 [Candidatus Persebacteraceae bacterium Df01]|jgi:large subunit ribosomal protein L6|uniref:50S ribosomal protein L6 n=1 Tax=Candidatus Doriopsillibacter californiensis TaxID=2970740 RepID=A0ABT7QKT0_9GAMM|nr:50S ribosomal protein L6 [Candidatus Persebacteraceae bacterium Df01]
MSRFIKNTIAVPSGVEVVFSNNGEVTAKGPAGEVKRRLFAPEVSIEKCDGGLRVVCKDESSTALSGTFWRTLKNMVTGVQKHFEVTLLLQGVGYRAQLAGNKVTLQLGFSHPVVYQLPAGVTADAPSQTELTLKGADKMLVGQTAAEIRAMRPPEPYKGKGVRYKDEQVIIKETKKK